MPNESGHNLQLDILRAQLNPDSRSDGVEYLYACNEEGNRRWKNLVSYLYFMQQEQPDVLLIGEAPGYRGTSVSGVPFLSEEIIRLRQSNGLRLPLGVYETSGNYLMKSGFEATSTFMWDVLDGAKAPKLPLLWAVFPNHPHVPGDMLTNRKPTKAEIAPYSGLITLLVKAYAIKHVIAVGNVAYDILSSNTDQRIIKLRHPARGGAKKFRDGFNEVMETVYGNQ